MDEQDKTWWVAWASDVLKSEGLIDWTPIVDPSGNWCHEVDKTVRVTPASTMGPGMWLHEIAHALRTRPSEAPIDSNLHDGRFADILVRLINSHCHAASASIRASLADKNQKIRELTDTLTAKNAEIEQLRIDLDNFIAADIERGSAYDVF
jgi:hypothetical protein